jgi:hypothetical protein
MLPLVVDGQFDLPPVCDAAQVEFVAQTPLVYGFEQTRSEFFMDLDRRTNHLLGQRVILIHVFLSSSLVVSSVSSVPLWCNFFIFGFVFA